MTAPGPVGLLHPAAIRARPPELRRHRPAVEDLRYASALQRAPISVPRPRERAAIDGVRFEVAFGAALKRMALPGYQLISGQWFTYTDKNGVDIAQTDHLLLGPRLTVLFECKRTQTDYAWHQLEAIYRPVVAMAYRRPVVICAVWKHLVGGMANPIRWLEALFEDPPSLDRHEWHVPDPKRLGVNNVA